MTRGELRIRTTGRPLWKVTKRTPDGQDETVCPDPEDDDRFRRAEMRMVEAGYTRLVSGPDGREHYAKESETP